MDSPYHVPAGSFSLQLDESCYSQILGCRHGLLLISLDWRNQVLVWDPVTGDQHHIDVPPGFAGIATPIHGAVLGAAAGEVHHFEVILVGLFEVEKQHMGVLACVYSSDTGVWGNLVSALITFDAYTTRDIFAIYFTGMSSVLVGNSLYWHLGGCSDAVLEFDLERQSLAVIHVPPPVGMSEVEHFTVMRAEGGGLGLLYVLDFTAQLWKRRTDCDGAVSWGMERSIELDKLLSLNPKKERVPPLIQGLAEYNNVLFLTTDDGVIMLQLESLQFKKFYQTSDGFYHHQFESVHSAGTIIGDGHDGAEPLQNT